MPPPGDAELIAGARRGDVGAFNGIVQRYETAVYGLCLRFLANTEAASDAAQETFVAAFRHFAGFRGGNLRSWLLRIAANRCRDELRRMRSRPTTSLDELVDEGEGLGIAAEEDETPEEATLRHERSRALAQALGHLSADQRLAVLLCDVEGLDYLQAAQAMGCSLGTVKSRLSRARAYLRDWLRERELLPVVRRLEKEGR
ncbi:MAG: sigma-70 family RNA polymerase sigma factor [Chloroflexi bacterium]|nr:sigma-70 family RNA polymerase sigma factor [Chloroflexota bacterium]